MMNTIANQNAGNLSGEPFGDSDAARVDLQTLKRGLIIFPTSDRIDSDDPIETSGLTRIIIGRKGSGKTLFLKLIQDSCKKNSDDNTGSIYFTDIDSSPPDSRLIIKVTAWFDDYRGMADEMWRKLWHITILRTIYGHVFNKKDFQKYLKVYEKESHTKANVYFADKYSRILPNNTVAINIYRQLENVLTRYNSGKDLINFLELSEWAEFETEMSELLKHLPPMYFFIDGLDEDYVNAPHHWLKCQYGLFNAVFRLIRNQQFGGRLHVIVCLREFVYSYVLQSEHGGRFLSESRIKVLKWNKKMLTYFLDKKIEILDDRYFPKKDEAKTLSNFFGFTEIFNKRHAKSENVYEYIFRHTMLMPRDIINIGNKYCHKLLHSGKNVDRQRLLKESVNEVAIQIASESLLLSALLINTRWIYKEAVEHQNLESFNDPTILSETKSSLMNLIKSIDKDRFPQKILIEKINNISSFGFSKEDSPFTALYHCGLLGFISTDYDGNDKTQFFSDLKSSELELPLTWSEYVFHSCLIDYLNIKPIGNPICYA